MSKPRYDWWTYVKGMIRRYPAMCKAKEDLQRTSVTVSYSGMPRGKGVSNPVQNAALRSLSKLEEKEMRSVRLAIEAIEKSDGGVDKIRLIREVYWSGGGISRRDKELKYACLLIPISETEAKRWHGEFVRMVAYYYGLFD